jgi:hypothetical protein
VKGKGYRLVLQDTETVTELVSTCAAHLVDLGPLKDSRTFAAEPCEGLLDMDLALVNKQPLSHVHKK